MSDNAYCLYLVRRALARPAGEIAARFLPRYEARLQELAQRLIGAGA